MTTDIKMGPVRPSFRMNDETQGKKRLVAGTDSSGTVIDIDEVGIEISGYYTGFGADSDTKYATLREPVSISWAELKKIEEIATAPKGKRKVKTDPDRIEEEIDEKYLDSLTIVTMNSMKFYIDIEKRERRPVNNPKAVWRY